MIKYIVAASLGGMIFPAGTHRLTRKIKDQRVRFALCVTSLVLVMALTYAAALQFGI